jgi:hypothetical protein
VLFAWCTKSRCVDRRARCAADIGTSGARLAEASQLWLFKQMLESPTRRGRRAAQPRSQKEIVWQRFQRLRQGKVGESPELHLRRQARWPQNADHRGDAPESSSRALRIPLETLVVWNGAAGSRARWGSHFARGARAWRVDICGSTFSRSSSALGSTVPERSLRRRANPVCKGRKGGPRSMTWTY